MGIVALRHLNQLIDDMLRGRLIRVTHAEIDNVLAAPAGREFQFVNLIEYVRWEPRDPRELFSQNDYTTFTIEYRTRGRPWRSTRPAAAAKYTMNDP